MSDRTLSRLNLIDRVDGGKVGTQIVYHIGSLMHDRQHGLDFLKVHSVAIAAYELYEKGKVHLAQRFILPGIFEYVAIVR